MEKNIKKRNWAMVVYPESLPPDWRDQLAKTGLPIAVSPLHDRDKDPTGENKKPHYHLILCYAGPTAFSVVKSIADSLGQPIPQPLESVKGYYRYLTHKDNPDKAQYADSDITTINGFNILDFTDITRAELHEIKIRLQRYIREKDIYEYCDLLDKLLEDGLMTEHEVAVNHTIFCNTYIKSRRYRRERKHSKEVVKVDKETGEVVE